MQLKVHAWLCPTALVSRAQYLQQSWAMLNCRMNTPRIHPGKHELFDHIEAV